MWKRVVDILFALIGSTTVVKSGKLFLNSTNSKFSNSNSARCNNTTLTSAHIKKESDSTLKYAAPATPTPQ